MSDIGKISELPRKKALISTLIVLAALVLMYVVQVQAMVVGIVGLICLMIISLPLNESICILFMVTPFVNLFSYRQINIFVFIVAAIIFKIILNARFLKAMFFMVLLLVYCMIFINTDIHFRIGSFIEPFLLTATLFVCGATLREVYRPALHSYTIGFIFSAFVGLLKDRLPTMQRLFSSDFLYVQGIEANETVRYAGLAGDPNYFAAISYILISIILFTNKKLNAFKIMAVLTIAVFGLFTYSKSYILMIIVIAIIFVLKNSTHIMRNAAIIGLVLLTLFVLENIIKTDVISLVFARFDNVETTNDLTTGRTELWIEYLAYIFQNTKCLFLGMGFNAASLDKAAHSTFIEFFYLFGIFGCMLWTVYISRCIDYVAHTADGKKLKITTIIPAIVFLVGFAFLNTFHFRELWCLSSLVLFATFMPTEEEKPSEQIKHNSTDLQR